MARGRLRGAEGAWQDGEDGEAVYDARQYLGVSEEDVEVLEVARVWYEERGCYDVALQTKDSGAVQHVLVDAQNGQTLASWAE